tara:strand:+ start:435 stop:590 length:156 start_codon:yes stop_codon:yes gene_type:complete
MLYQFKKQKERVGSAAVIRAISRLNEHENQKSSRSIVWNGRSITKPLSITS